MAEISKDFLKGLQVEDRVQYLIPEPGKMIIGIDGGIKQDVPAGQEQVAALTPGPGEVIIGGTDGPVAVSAAGRDVVVAASDAPLSARLTASYTATGTNDHLVINTAIATGHPVILSEGTFNLGKASGGAYSIQPLSGARLFGQGAGKTILRLADTVADGTAVIKTEEGVSDVEIAYLTIDGNKTARGATVQSENEGINLKSPTRAFIHHVHVHDCGQDGIDLDSATDCIVSDAVIEDCGGCAVHMAGDTLNRFGIISRVVSRNNAHDRRAWQPFWGYAINGCGGYIRISDCVSENDAIGIALYSVFYGSITGCIVSMPGDGTPGVGQPGISIDGGGHSNLVANNIVHNRGNPPGAVGIYAGESGSVDRSRITDNIIVACEYGVRVDGGTMVDVTGNTIHSTTYGVGIANMTGSWSVRANRMNLTTYGVYVQSGDGVVDGNIVTGAATGGIDIRGAISGVTVTGNSIPSGVGIRMINSGGTPTGCIVTDNVLGSGVTIAPLGTGHTIRRNTGYVTEARGSTTVPAGSATVVVNHGLSSDPTVVVATTRSNEGVWITGRGATQFTINRTVTTLNLIVDWYAEV